MIVLININININNRDEPHSHSLAHLGALLSLDNSTTLAQAPIYALAFFGNMSFDNLELRAH